jgi:hypothetical protein
MDYKSSSSFEHMIWHSGNLAIWQSGNLAIWQSGNLAAIWQQLTATAKCSHYVWVIY